MSTVDREPGNRGLNSSTKRKIWETKWLSVCGVSPVKCMLNRMQDSSERTQRRYHAKANQYVLLFVVVLTSQQISSFYSRITIKEKKNRQRQYISSSRRGKIFSVQKWDLERPFIIFMSFIKNKQLYWKVHRIWTWLLQTYDQFTSWWTFKVVIY